MKITKVKFYVDLKNITISEEFSSNQCNLYIMADNIDYPHKNYMGLPITIFRWLLKELRLLIVNNITIKERYVYFYPDTNNYFIQFEMIDNERLKIILNNRRAKNSTFLHTIFYKEGKSKKTELYCDFNELFKEVYEYALLINDACSKVEVYGGDIYELQTQLRLSKSLYNKIIRSS
jgi:hypothetical protein